MENVLNWGSIIIMILSGIISLLSWYKKNRTQLREQNAYKSVADIINQTTNILKEVNSIEEARKYADYKSLKNIALNNQKTFGIQDEVRFILRKLWEKGKAKILKQ